MVPRVEDGEVRIESPNEHDDVRRFTRWRATRDGRVLRLAGVGALGLCLLTLWSFLAPLSEPPDEIQHLDMAYYLTSGESYPNYDERPVGGGALSLYFSHFFLVTGRDGRIVSEHRTVESATPERLNPTYAERGGNEPDEDSVNKLRGLMPGVGDVAWLNQMTQHPPLYYLGSTTALRASRHLPGGSDLSMHAEVHLLRLLNVAMTAAIPIIAWFAARRLGASEATALTASLLVLCVPEFTHIGAVVNNDNLLTLLTSLLVLPLVAVFRGDLRHRTAVAIGVVTGLAFLTKAFALVLPPWIALCYLVALRRQPERRRQGLTSLGLAGGIVVVLSGWWWVRNLIRHGTPAPSTHGSNPLGIPTPPGFEPDFVGYVSRFTVLLVDRFWARVGTLHSLPVGIVIAATASVAILVVTAFVRRPPTAGQPSHHGGPRRLELATLSSIAGLLLAFVFVRAWLLYADTGREYFINGRYLFGAIVPLAVVAAVGANRLLHRWSPLAALGAVMLMQGAGIHLALERLWGAPGASLRSSWDGLVAWNPWPIPLVSMTALAIVILVGVCAFLLAKQALAPDPSDQGPGPAGHDEEQAQTDATESIPALGR